MSRAANKQRVLMTGVRKGGDPDYHFKIFGNPASQFPPLILKMSLHEMQQWLIQTDRNPVESPQKGRHSLKPVG